MKTVRSLVIFMFVFHIMGCGAGPNVPEEILNPEPSNGGKVSFEPLTLNIDSGNTWTNQLNVNLTLGAQNAQEMYLTTEPDCLTGGIWEPFATTKTHTLALTNQINTIYFKVRNSSQTEPAESACISSQIQHDNLLPSLAISSPAASSYVNLSNVSATTLSGSCSEEGKAVILNGSYGATSNCASGAWAVTMNLNLLAEGPLHWTASQTDAAGNTASTADFSLTKDTTPPTSNSLSIQGGATTTNTLNVTLTMASSGASEMYITDSPTCSIGGIWESFSSTKSWTLPVANSTNTVYGKFRDLAGNESVCINQSILHDDILPTVTFASPAANSYINLANVTHWNLSGSCSENGKNVVISGAFSFTTTCTSGNWSTSLDVSSLPEGLATLYVDHQDATGNSAIPASRNFNKDTVAPTLSFTLPAANTPITIANSSALTFSGSCSENGLNVHLGGDVNTNATCTSGSWTKVLNLTALADGPLTFTVTHQDAASNQASSISQTFTKTTAVPTLTLASPLSGAFVNIANQTAVNFSGTCSENGQPVVLSGDINTSATCTGGNWSKLLDLSAFPDAPFSVAIDHQSAVGNQANQITATYGKDTVSPTLTLASPISTDFINSSNVTSVVISGTCSENSRSVSISGAVTTSATCSTGSFTKSVNFTAVADGLVTLNIDHSDAAGNPAAQATVTLTKDVVAPSSNSLVINGNAAITTTTAVTLALNSIGAQDMYITEDPTCATGGAWEAFASSKAWNLVANNATVSVWMKTKDLAGNVSGCVGDSILHDDTAPLWSDAPAHVAVFNSLTDSPAVSYTETATDDLGSGIQKYQYAIGTGTADVSASDIAAWTDVSGGSFTATGLTLTDGVTYFVNMRVYDNAGNLTQQSSIGWLADTTPPVLTVTNPLNNQTLTESDFLVTGTCDNAYTIEVTYGAGIAGPSSASCSAGVYQIFLEITGTSGSRTLTLSQTDSGNNVTTVTVTYSYQLRLTLNGQILAMQKLPDGSSLYGGTFTSLTLNRDMFIARTNTDGSKDSNFLMGSGFNDQVYAFAELADGSVLVGGAFTTYRGRPANRIAKLSSTGVLDTTFNPTTGNNGAAGIVRTIAVSGSSIYIGGDFTKYRGTTVNRIAKIDSNGVLDLTYLGTGTVGFSSGSIYSIAASGGAVYIGGSFTSYRGGVANRIAKTDATSGALDTTFNPTSGNNGANNNVRAISLIGTDVFLAGDFTAYRGTALKYLAKVSSSGVLDATFSTTTGPSAAVYALANDGTNIYLGGTFTTYKSAASNRIAKVNALTAAMDTTFSPSTGGNGAANTVNSISYSGGALYIGGLFTTYRNLNASRVAKVGTDGTLDSTYNPSTGANGTSGAVNAVFGGANGIYVGGGFYSYRNSSIANYIAKIDSSGNLDTTFNSQVAANGFNNTVRALALSGTTIFAGGDFTAYRGGAANRIAKLDANGALDTTFNPTSGNNGANNLVWAIAVYGADVFIGGDFTTYKGTALKYLAKLNFSGTLDATFSTTTGPSSSVYAIVTDGTSVYIGGKFTTYKSVSANRVAKLAYSNAALDTVFSPSANNGGGSTVNALMLNGSSLFMGGALTTYRGTTVNRIAKVDKASGDLDSTFLGTGTVGYGSTVNALATDGTSLYVTGAFTTYRGAAAKYLSKVDLVSGVQDNIFTSGNGLSGTGVVGSSLLWDGSNLMVGGIFTYYLTYQYGNYVLVNASGAVQ